MDIGDIVPFIVFIFVLLALVGGIGGVVYLVLRLRNGEPVTFPLRLLFRVYIYMILLISLITSVVGLSHLAQAGLGAALGKEFSYNPVYKGEPFRLAPVTDKTGEPVDQTEEADAASEEQRREEGLDRALKEGLLNGLSLAIVGGAVLALHAWGRRRLETEEERKDVVQRIYLILMLVIFGVITLVTLPSAVFETLRYYLLDTSLQDFRDRPGAALGTAIVSLPVWAYYLRSTIALLRRQEDRIES